MFTFSSCKLPLMFTFCRIGRWDNFDLDFTTIDREAPQVITPLEVNDLYLWP